MTTNPTTKMTHINEIAKYFFPSLLASDIYIGGERKNFRNFPSTI